MLVQQILKMKSGDGVVTLAPGATLADAAKLLSEKKFGAVVISPDGSKVAGIMTSKITTCTRSEGSGEVLKKMTSGRFRHMPVMEGDEMVGLISIGDVVKAQLAELAMEKEALESMIKGF